MFRLVTKEYHVGHPECSMIELIDHSIYVLKALALFLLIHWKTNMPDKIPKPDRGKHDPIYSRKFSSNILIGNFYELVPLEFGES